MVARVRHRKTGLAGVAWLLFCLGSTGCANAWDEITSRDFSFKACFAAKPDPLVVLSTSTDGDKRASALRDLKDPKIVGVDPERKEAVFKVLSASAVAEHQPLCRLAAISALRSFHDPRVPKALEDAYYRAAAGNFSPDTVTVIRCQTLEALGETGDPLGLELLIRVVKEPPVEGPEQDQVMKSQERAAAARALGLGKYKNYEATAALLNLLKTERDNVALRDIATKSLRDVTGKDFPADANVWADFLQQSGPVESVQAGGKEAVILPVRNK